MKITCRECAKAFTEIPADHECDCGGTVNIEFEEVAAKEPAKGKNK